MTPRCRARSNARLTPQPVAARASLAPALGQLGLATRALPGDAALVGQFGRAVSDLRPSGKIQIGEEILFVFEADGEADEVGAEDALVVGAAVSVAGALGAGSSSTARGAIRSASAGAKTSASAKTSAAFSETASKSVQTLATAAAKVEQTISSGSDIIKGGGRDKTE